LRLWRQRSAPPLRYYLYISDSKLDMLFEQIDHGVLKRISAEVKVDLKLASVTLKRAENPVPARTAKLRVVERFINTHHTVGTVQQPGAEYVRGTMDMQWGWVEGTLSRKEEENDKPDRGGEIVIFRGQEASDFVALAGSRRHVLGEHPAETDVTVAFTGSALPNIIAAFGEHISENPELAERVRTFRTVDPRFAASEEVAAVSDPPQAHLDAAMSLRIFAPTQRLEFLAVALNEAQMMNWHPSGLKKVPSGIHGVLGTPIYVALARQPAQQQELGS
jgi:hypothetical protein